MGLLKIIAEKRGKEWEELDVLEKMSRKYKLSPRQKFSRRLIRATLLIQSGYLDLAEDEIRIISPLTSSLQEHAEILHLKRKITKMRKKHDE